MDECNYQFFQAEVKELPSSKDSRLTIKIIPHMIGIDEISLLPKWPTFFKDENLGGIKINSKVWVIGLPDFSAGWVLGLANKFSFDLESDNSDFNQIMNGFIQKIKTSGMGNLKVDNIRIFFYDDNFLDCYDSENKTKISINRDGSYSIMSDSRVGLSYKGKSSITLNDQGINISTNGVINFTATEVNLGGSGNRIATVLTDNASDGSHTIIVPSQIGKA